MVKKLDLSEGTLDVSAISSELGPENLERVLLVLEQLEGVRSQDIEEMSQEERFEHVLALMQTSLLYQTRH